MFPVEDTQQLWMKLYGTTVQLSMWDLHKCTFAF